MAVLAVYNDQLLMAESSTSLTITSDPIAMGGANYVEVSTNVENLFNVGAAAGRLVMEVWEGNDGQNWNFSTGITHTYTTTEMVPVGGAVRSAFIRLQYKYDSTAGGAGDITVVTFDCHANLMHD